MLIVLTSTAWPPVRRPVRDAAVVVRFPVACINAAPSEKFIRLAVELAAFRHRDLRCGTVMRRAV